MSNSIPLIKKIDINQWLIDFINGWLEFQSTIDKIYQPLIGIYQTLIGIYQTLIFLSMVRYLTMLAVTVTKIHHSLTVFGRNVRFFDGETSFSIATEDLGIFPQICITFKTILWKLWASYPGLLDQNNMLKVLIKWF